VVLKVYNLIGKEVATLVDETKPTGLHDVQFDAQSLSSGVYFYTLRDGGLQATRKMVLMK
ncbi:MAG: Spore coat-like protein, partial [Bacteroidetes bacterium]|nr:Spore coat-like protein [Bacteroidota bacterium]